MTFGSTKTACSDGGTIPFSDHSSALHVCIFQTRNCTCWGSEEVKVFYSREIINVIHVSLKTLMLFSGMLFNLEMFIPSVQLHVDLDLCCQDHLKVGNLVYFGPFRNVGLLLLLSVCICESENI